MDGQKPEQAPTPTPTQFAPGDTIRPQQVAAPASIPQPAEPAQSPQLPAQPVASPQPNETVAPAVTEQPMAASELPSLPPTEAEPLSIDDDDYSSEPTEEVITWTASEFIAHHKTGSWYVLLLLASCMAAGLIWFMTKDIVSAVVVVFAGAMLATYAARKPRQLSYQLDPAGLTIGDKHLSYNEFRSFSVVPEGAFSSIVFSPLKRFGTLTTIYYDPQDEARIVDAISQRLPHEEHRLDAIDGMMRRIRF
jgi:hypothetical protein